MRPVGNGRLPEGDVAATIPRHRFPVDPWRLVETEPSLDDLGTTETLFAIGNGHLGIRATPDEGRPIHRSGTFVNGFHETWPIHHAEEAFGFARTGQTIVDVPDGTVVQVFVDDDPLRIGEAGIDHYERVLDFRTGVLRRDVVWRTVAGERVHVRSERLVSLRHRHLAVVHLEVTLLDADAPLRVSSGLRNRRDGAVPTTDGDAHHESDPRRSRRFDRRILVPVTHRHDDPDDPAGGLVTLVHRCAVSAMVVAAAYRHEISGVDGALAGTTVTPDGGETAFDWRGVAGTTVRITKFLAYHVGGGHDGGDPGVDELTERCRSSVARARHDGLNGLHDDQERRLDTFWERSDIVVDGDPALQQAVRWNLHQVAQATVLVAGHGVAAKGVTSDGYDGHYFWDTEIHVVPFLASTNPEAARSLVAFRASMLDAARRRARDLDQRGALYPWRTINGEEASAHYAAGTAQYHINSAIAYALEQYVRATGDDEFLARHGAEILVETARLYEDLGFFSEGDDGHEQFHIHGVTGPDEYTTVVDDNLYTNVMARFTMRFAARTVTRLRDDDPERHAALVHRTGVTDAEVAGWHRACDAMAIAVDAELGIHPQDARFLDREPWDFAGTPPGKYPLMLHFHPLVIYRHQVLKQADVVLALHLRGEHFTVDEKRRDFDYYDPITTGDSSLSACIQAIVAAEVGHDDLALAHFRRAAYLDLADLHRNTADGVHVANAAGVRAALVHGFAGYDDDGTRIRLTPRLPAPWRALSFRMLRRGTDLRVTVDRSGATLEVLDGEPVTVAGPGGETDVGPGGSVVVPASAG